MRLIDELRHRHYALKLTMIRMVGLVGGVLVSRPSAEVAKYSERR